MQYHHLYSDDQGESHWQEVGIDLTERVFAPPAQGILVSEPETVRNVVFLRLPAGWDEPAHPSPHPQVLICLKGRVCVTASDGDTREIAPGDIWRMEDLTGKGHHTRVTGTDDFEAAIVQFA
ncbi:cupin [Ruegeria sp. 2012CJ41-6]|uniref:Cupin n=1 Tax=Ruegeria spongiae TaxID=2942209 RepID=A0ABT0Q1K5_9RHOB|nr:cupin domain-containing protein [Ruegeria spongiae]MCL6283764.1 cupin [Ruegeria spongiae]